MINRVAITCALTTFIFLAGLAVLTTWLADTKPKPPSFSIPQAALTDFTFSGNLLNATFSFTISAHNRDPRYTIVYHVVVVSVYQAGYTLAYRSVSPFTQPHGVTHSFGARPVAQDVLVSDPNVARALSEGTRPGGKLSLEVRVRAAVRFEVRGWKHRHYTLMVQCDPVQINFESAKSFQATNCDVDRY